MRRRPTFLVLHNRELHELPGAARLGRLQTRSNRPKTAPSSPPSPPAPPRPALGCRRAGGARPLGQQCSDNSA
eukprot:6782709-Alexandrium_andersonii.AAC.1